MKIRGYALLFSLLSLSLTLHASNDFDIRAYYVDHRAEVMTMSSLKSLVDRASKNGINAVVMEWESTFPFVENSTLNGEHVFARGEVADFIAYASERGVQIIPLQNCFGHCEYILRHERYASLREDSRDWSQVCPLRFDEAREVFTSIFKEIAQVHPSPYIHIGCDEIRLLGHCKRCSRHGSDASLYSGYVSLMCSIVQSLGKTPVIWADIIEREPEIIPSLPEGVVVVDWNYGWKVSEKEIDALLERGMTLWGASSLRCSPDNVHLTQWDVHFDNLRDYVPFCREKGFSGMIQTSWSTSGRYGYLMDDKSVIDMQPIRQVWPMSAFGVLLDAFACAIAQDEPLDREAFVKDWAEEHFGLEEAEAQPLLLLFSTPQLPVDGRNLLSARIESERASVEGIYRALSAVHPRKGKAEYAQYLLMLEVRLNYLAYADILQEVESGRPYDAASLKRSLKRLRKDGVSLRRRFEKVQDGYLVDPSAPLGNWSYLQGMENLYKRL